MSESNTEEVELGYKYTRLAIKASIQLGIMFGASTVTKAAFEKVVTPSNAWQKYTLGATRMVATAYITDQLMEYVDEAVDGLFLAPQLMIDGFAEHKAATIAAMTEASDTTND